MTEYIYGDILFIINFSMDFLSLFITGKIMHFRMGTIRMILAASIGAFYGVASLFFSVGAVTGILIDLICALIICFVAHYHGSAVKTFAATALFYGVSMLLGGVMTAIYTKIGRYKSYIEVGGTLHTVFGDIELWVFFLIAIVSAIVTFFLQKMSHRRTDGKFCRVKMRFDGKEYEFSGFFDSGNMVTEPISGKPVVFLSSDAVKKMNNADRKPIFCLCNDINIDSIGDIAEHKKRDVCFVPLSTVSGGGLAVALRPERFEILIKSKYEERDVLVSSDENAADFCGAEALVPTSLI